MQANMTVEPKAIPGRASLRQLAALEGPWLTIYLAGHKAGSGSRPMRVRMQALLGDAEQLLERRGVLPTDRESLLLPLRARLNEGDLGSGHGSGLVLFRNPSRFEEFWLPWEVEDLLAFESGPLLTPLVAGLQNHRRFLLLALSRKNTRMLECGPADQQSLPLPAGVPKGIDELEGFDTPDHARGQTGGGVKFGMDTSAEKLHLYLHDFCRALERGLQPLFEQRGLPLVLAGGTGELAAYRAVNRYALLAPEAIEGSPDGGWTDADMAAKGRVAIKDWRPAEVNHAVDLYMRAGPDKKSTEVEGLLRAAAAGRVLHLFLDSRLGETGDVDRILGRTLLSGAIRCEEDHLANAAAVETWRHDGQVWCIEGGLESSSVSAVYRW